jgi:putative NADPH-quinone reductase
VKILAIAGSPRRKGNTDALLEQTIAGARSAGAEVEHVILSRMVIAPCKECNRCFKTGRCVVLDDYQVLYDKTLEADGIILAAPIFFMNVSAQAKTFIDRFQCLWARRYVLHDPLPPPAGGAERRAVFLSTAGWSKTKFDGALSVVRAFLSTIQAQLIATLCINAIDDVGDVKKHSEFLDQAFALGVQLASEVAPANPALRCVLDSEGGKVV